VEQVEERRMKHGRGVCLRAALILGAAAAAPASASAVAVPAKAWSPAFAPTRAAVRGVPDRALSLAAPRGYLFAVDPAANAAMRAAGAVPVMPAIGIWKVDNFHAGALQATLLARGALRDVSVNRVLRLRAATPMAGPEPPLPIGPQYMFAAIGAFDPVTGAAPLDPLTGGPLVSPAVPRPLFFIDAGTDFTTPDFANRGGPAPAPNFGALNVAENAQDTSGALGAGEWHGTGTASTAAAAANGLGIVGVVPNALLGAWDASSTDSACQPEGCIDSASELMGIQRAIDRRYPIVNMSLGAASASYPAPAGYFTEYLAIQDAFAHGILVVVSAGNERDQGNPYEYPGDFPHVLTVAATMPDDSHAFFSNSLPMNDVAAPGWAVGVQVPANFDLGAQGSLVTCTPELPAAAGWCDEFGTSFSAPIVAGVASWVWAERPDLSNAQVFNLLRASARDVGAPGFDGDTGYGVVSIPNALAYPRAALPKDSAEPNDDIPMINGAYRFGPTQPFLMRRSQRYIATHQWADVFEDFEDVFRIQRGRPARLRLKLAHPGGQDLDVCVWTSRARDVYPDLPNGRDRQLLGCSTQRGGRPDVLTVRTARSPGLVYVDVYVPVPRSRFRGSYTLSIKRIR
jgi:hypothetical protein